MGDSSEEAHMGNDTENASADANALGVDRRTVPKVTGETALAGGLTSGMTGTAAAAAGTAPVETADYDTDAGDFSATATERFVEVK